MTWGDDLAAWWIGEVASDPAYDETVVPLALEVAAARPGERWLDLGCGEGRMMRALSAAGADPVGCDVSPRLAAAAGRAGPAVVGRLPDLDWLTDDAVDGALAVLVLEHLPDLAPLFAAAARVVRPCGTLAVVLNHPLLTSPGSAPVVDPDDGEVLWRWGRYLEEGSTAEPAGAGSVEFLHRPLGALLTLAAGMGWRLEAAVERGVGDAQAGRDPLLAMQRDIPRLLGVRWRNPA
ncbi:MAG: class I SAM-dependent methyltransferase [Actinobacteria bacterium]|nr:class I SAM-dependent methyltransferase [Actinomycetota bacterium]